MRPRIPFWVLCAVTAAAATFIGGHSGPSFSAGIPLRVAIGLNLLFGLAAWRVGGVNASGAVAGAVIATALLAAAGWPAWLMLVATFMVTTGATRVGARTKQAAGVAEALGGRRAAGNVVANTGIAALWAVWGATSGDAMIAQLGLGAALATAASDSTASEIGKATAGATLRLWPFGRVVPGTNGAISMAGTAAGVATAGVLGAVSVATGLAPEWHQGLVMAAAATMALLGESVIAPVAEDTGWLDNNGVNFVNSLLGSVLAISLV